MKRIFNALFILFCTLPTAAAADVPPSQAHEVQHLLHFVAASECEMDRNGEKHTGKEAVSHIQKKYDYFKEKIKTTEEFIEYAATKSTISGRYYLITCQDLETIKVKDWLLNELDVYRANYSNENR